MAKIKGHCKICGAEMSYCNDCTKVGAYVSWKTICDTENHYKIYQTLIWYGRNQIDKSEAKTMLSNCDLTGLDSFEAENILMIHEIMEQPTVKARSKKRATNTVETTSNEEKIDTLSVDATSIIE